MTNNSKQININEELDKIDKILDQNDILLADAVGIMKNFKPKTPEEKQEIKKELEDFELEIDQQLNDVIKEFSEQEDELESFYDEETENSNN
ncbi:MAG TPA: hypothetical protein PJ997_02275 [Candidatus Paceibacterota bacterium]|nr:hypothetical protein [Candidatus Paceibacterota bacterium]HMP19140.1 hypothetical protein [Candidatus Paceibacterota bacterium]HMP85151.1 hypothetical protein [Candidatus Paceibacterota bacterium]